MSELVILVNPGRYADLATQEPLNLGYIASYLEKHNIEVKIIDQLAGDNVEGSIRHYKPGIVGITATTVVVNEAYKIADFCRQQKILTVMGGVHASIMSEEALQHCDLIVRGEGEIAMLDIVRGNIGPESKIITRPYIKNIDDVPIPARHLMKMDFYAKTKDRLSVSHLYFVKPGMKVAAVLTGRGCPYRCIFCYNSWRDTPVRFHSAERVLSEIEHLKNHYGTQAIFFFDDELFFNKKRMKDLCKQMIEKKINVMWGAQARADSMDDELVEIAKRAGCRQIGFGFESGADRILKILKNDSVTVEQNKNAVEICNRQGIFCWGTFMIGNPTETMEDIELTRRFIRENKINGIMVHITTPFPGTKLWNDCVKRGDAVKENINWDEFTTAGVCMPVSENISREELEKKRNEILLKDVIMRGKFDMVAAILSAFRHPFRQIPKAKRLLKGIFR